jgi:Zn ribbon nucleic-acid-binding protein
MSELSSDELFCPACGGDDLAVWIKADRNVGPEKFVEFVECQDCGHDCGPPLIPEDWDYIEDCGWAHA